jgi:hypothetical protein
MLLGVVHRVEHIVDRLRNSALYLELQFHSSSPLFEALKTGSSRPLETLAGG